MWLVSHRVSQAGGQGGGPRAQELLPTAWLRPLLPPESATLAFSSQPSSQPHPPHWKNACVWEGQWLWVSPG